MNMFDLDKDVFSITDVGLVREANEDNCDATSTVNGFLFVVCDGMGGHVGGARASKIAVKSIVDYMSRQKYGVIQQALSEALIFANEQILAAAAAEPELKGMGTTACVVLAQDDKVWYAHIGDSRIYLFCNKEQRLHRLTKDHSFVQGLVDQGMISEQEAENHPDRNKLTKTLGIYYDIEPAIGSMPVLPAKKDIFLICSDGLYGMVPDNVLEQVLAKNISLPEKGMNMLTLAMQAGGTDNVTVQLICISDSPHQNSIFSGKNALRPEKARKAAGGKMLLPVIIAIISLLLMIFMLLRYLKP